MTIVDATTLGCQASHKVSDHDILAFLKAVHGEDASVCFQTFDDRKEGKPRAHLAKNWHSDINNAALRELAVWNGQGAGAFHCVNETNGQGRTAKDIVGLNALFGDYDDGDPQNLDKLPPPSAIIRSKNGVHLYWFLAKGQPVEQFRAYQEMLIELTGSDKKVKDPSRVLRLPGFLHLKQPSDPYMVQLVELHPERRYSLSDFPTPDAKALKASKKRSSQPSIPISSTRTVEALEELVKQYRSKVNPAKLPSKRVNSIIDKVASTITSVSLGAGANSALYKASVMAATLLTRGGLSVGTVLETILETAKAHYSNQESKVAWNAAKDKDTAIGGLLAGVANAMAVLEPEQHKLTNAVVMDAQYVADMNIDYTAHKLTVVQSPIGTGKTTDLKRFIRDVLTKQPKQQIRLVLHRVALVEQWYEELRDLGFVAYNDSVLSNVKSHASVPLLVVTYDSLHLLDGSSFPNGLVVLDEVDQGLTHLLTCTETSVRETRYTAITVLQRLVRGSSHVVAMSATASDRDVEILKVLAESEDVQSYVNDHKPFQKRFKQLLSYDAAYSQVAADIKSGLNVAVVMDNAGMAMTMQDQLAKEYPGLPIACVTAETKNLYDLANINALVKQYQVFIYSPTLGTGVDICCKHFDNVVGIFNNPDITYQDNLQAIGRVRSPNGTVSVYIDPRMNWQETDEDYIKERYRLAQLALMPVQANPDTCLPDVHPLAEPIVAWQLGTLQYDARGRVAKAAKFWQSIRDAGHIVELAVTEEVTHTEGQLKEAKKALKVERAIRVSEAPVLSPEAFDALTAKKKADKLTPDQQLQVERAYCARALYGDVEAAVTPDEVVWYEKSGKKVLKTIRLAAMTPAQRVNADLTWTETTSVNGGLDGKFYVRDGDVLDKLLDALKPTLEAGQFSKYSLDGFMAVVKDLGVDAVRHLGVRVDLKDPCGTAKSLLELNGWDVECKNVRVTGTLTQSVSLREVVKVSVPEPEGNQGKASARQRLYSLTRTDLINQIATRLEQQVQAEPVKQDLYADVEIRRAEQEALRLAKQVDSEA